MQILMIESTKFTIPIPKDYSEYQVLSNDDLHCLVQ